jgi:hypothetical protein
MSRRQIISLISLAALGIVCLTADAFAARVAARGGAVVHRGAVGVSGGAVGYRGGAYRGGYYRPGVGVAAGAVVGGAIAASQYGYGGNGYNYGQGYGYTSGGQDAAYCAQRYRSNDATSGTYLGNDGLRHPCP